MTEEIRCMRKKFAPGPGGIRNLHRFPESGIQISLYFDSFLSFFGLK
jgi:hypothetical protein